MPTHELNLTAIVQTLENETHLVEALCFPEVSCYGDNLSRLLDAIKANGKRIAEDSPLLELHRRRASAAPTVSEVKVVLDPPSRRSEWTMPITLVFHVLRWSHDDYAHIAFVPALGIEVVAQSPEELDRLIPDHIRFALLRTKAATSLARLVELQRSREVRVEALSFKANIRTPKQIAADEEREETQKPVIEEVGSDLTREPLTEAYEVDDLVEQIADAVGGANPRSVLLVGPSGVGKTAAVHELVRRRKSFQLHHTLFWATSGSRLVAGMSGFGMWQERCQRLAREASKQRAALHLGNLVELIEVGKSAHSGQGIAGFLRPYLARGDIVAIAECAPEQVPVIEREEPHLLDVFHQIKVEEPSAEKGTAILSKCAAALSSPSKATIGTQGVDTLDRLHRRYATYSAYPGRPLRFMKNLLRDSPDEKTLGPRDVAAAFSRETGLPLFMLDDSVPLDLIQTRNWLAERIIGQPEAADLVVDLLTTAKAGLTRPRKPIASLLFIGPTGVGKTEMAKSLAEFLFGDKTRMTRFDMTEYSDPVGVRRLIGGVFGSEGLLTAKVREQPFAVILLDEFEKAHPSFFDLLLQVLGEGRLTDAAGRVADFCNSVVIMTSNLGAESFQQGPVGFVEDSNARSDARAHFLEEVRAFVRPELFNRIDRVVPFAPLDEETVLKIAERELELIRRRDGVLLRRIELNVSADVVSYLAKKGYDPRYGARPLKRAIARELLVPLADAVNGYSSELPLAARMHVEGSAIHVRVRTRKDDSGKLALASPSNSGVIEIASNCADLRRRIQRLARSPAVLDLHNEIFSSERLRRRFISLSASRPSKKPSAETQRQLSRLPKLKSVADLLKELSERVTSLENDALLMVFGNAPAAYSRLVGDLSLARSKWDALLLSLYSVGLDRADRVTLAVYSEHPSFLFDLARAYYSVGSAKNSSVSAEGKYRVPVCQFVASRDGRKEGSALKRLQVKNPDEFLGVAREGVIGVAMEISGPHVYPRFEPERGLHIFKDEAESYKCLVHTSEAPLVEYQPPKGIDRRGAISRQTPRRLYELHRASANDVLLDKRFSWSPRRFAGVLAAMVEEHLRREVQSQVEG